MSGEDRRDASVRLQLDRGNGVENYDETHPITNGAALSAPDLTIGASSVRLEGMQYRIHLDLRGPNGRRVVGDLTVDASPGRLFPRAEFTGARGWLTGYVVPVMSGALNGALDVNGERISLDGGAGYHDHNWGFWKGMSWRWGQVQHGRPVAAIRPHFPSARGRRSRPAARLPRRGRAPTVRSPTRPTSRLPKQTTNGASRARSP